VLEVRDVGGRLGLRLGDVDCLLVAVPAVVANDLDAGLFLLNS
jgi:hypothetical protein